MRRLLLVAVCAAFLAGVGCSSSTTTASGAGGSQPAGKDMPAPGGPDASKMAKPPGGM